MQGIRDLLQSSNTQHENKFQALQKSMDEIAQNSEIKKCLNFVIWQYDDLKIKVEDLEKERKKERNYMNQLEEKVLWEDMSKLEIRNVPKMERESREDLKHILAKITYFRFD